MRTDTNMINDLQEFRIKKEENMEVPKHVIKHKKLVLLCLAIVILIESFWAFSYIKSANMIKLPLITQLMEKPKEKIASMSLTPSNIQAKVGENFEISVDVDMLNRTVNGIDAVIKYDPQMLEVVDADNDASGTQVSTGTIFNTLLINSVDPLEGKIFVTGSRISTTDEPVNGVGTIAKISLVSLQAGNTTLEILYDPQKSNLSNVTESKTSKNILTHINNVQITISQ